MIVATLSGRQQPRDHTQDPWGGCFGLYYFSRPRKFQQMISHPWQHAQGWKGDDQLLLLQGSRGAIFKPQSCPINVAQ